MFVVVDIETTGLSEHTDLILEVGALLTDDQLEVIGQANFILETPSSNLKNLDPVVQEMHEKSRLLDLIKENRTAPGYQVDKLLVKWLEDNNATGLPMCGSSVHFDRAFLKKRLPLFEACFHYRNIDVSTLKEVCNRWLPEGDLEKRPEPKKLHRALPDCEDTIEELKFYYRTLFGGLV